LTTADLDLTVTVIEEMIGSRDMSKLKKPMSGLQCPSHQKHPT
jgi:hypothetical protein